MIDTIRFAIDRISKPLLRELITFQDASQGRIRFYRYEDRKGHTHQKDVVKSHLTSDSYRISYTVDLNAMSCDFEFSIPKYIYGHNLYTYPLNKEDVIYELKEFFKKFFLDNFNEIITMDNIRILRIDICYNHVFESEKLKHRYKKLIIDNATTNFPPKNVRKWENETVMIKYQDYSFKMYDKGLEFYENDYKELIETMEITELNKLLEYAKKILRFEFTFRNNKISDILMNNYIFLIYPNVRLTRKIVELKKFHNKIQALTNYIVVNVNKYKKTKNPKYETKVWDRLEHSDYKTMIFNTYFLRGYIKSDRYIKEDYILDCFEKSTKMMLKEYNKLFNAKKFYLEISEIERQLNKDTIGFSYTFNQLLINIMFDLFNDKLKKLTNTFQFNNTSLKNIILHNFNEIRDQMNILPNKLINYLDNPDMMVHPKTLNRYLENLKTISEKYTIEDHNINFLLK